MRFYFDQFAKYKEKFLEAKKAGDMVEARHCLLLAAEYLFKLARETKGDLRESRVETAWRLLRSAQEMKTAAQGGDGGAAPSSAGAQRGPSLPAADKDDESGAKRWILLKKPNVFFRDVAGLDDVKDLIRKRVIYPFQNPEITEKYRKDRGGGVLLYGPPGTGKTMIAKAIATELDAVFFDIKCSDIMSKWVGEAEKNLADLFQEAKSYPRAVVFFDEAEAIVGKRGRDSTIMNRVIPEFLSQVDGMDPKENCLLILGATNRPWDMDEASLRTGRFGDLIYVGLPDYPARRKILDINLRDVPMAPDVDLDELARRLESFSGADIKGICQAATDYPFDREIKFKENSFLTKSDIDNALAKRKPSVPGEYLARYRAFQAKYGG